MVVGARLDFVRTITKGRRINDLRDETRTDDQIPEILRRRGAIRGGGQLRVMVDFFDDTLIAEGNGIRCRRVEQVPADVSGFDLSAQLGCAFRGRIVIDDLDIRVGLHVGIMISLLLTGSISTSPGDDDQRRFGRRDCCQPGQYGG